MSLDDESAKEKAAEAVGKLLQEVEPDAMPLSFVVLVELMDRDGKKGLWMLSAPDQAPHESLGLMHYAISIENAATIADHLESE